MTYINKNAEKDNKHEREQALTSTAITRQLEKASNHKLINIK